VLESDIVRLLARARNQGRFRATTDPDAKLYRKSSNAGEIARIVVES